MSIPQSGGGPIENFDQLAELLASGNKPKDEWRIRTEPEKFRNAAKEIKERHETGQPVLVGTISVEKSEHLSAILKKMGVRHEVLNAKNHEREAFSVSQAARRSSKVSGTSIRASAKIGLE